MENINNEIWKDVIGYEGLYMVSNTGKVKRVCSRKGEKINRILKTKYKKSGYCYICLSCNGVYKYYHIHRLVAIAFLENKDNKPCVNHKDLNKNNNNVHNLEWCTPRENNAHARKNLIFKINPKKGIDNAKCFPICQMDLNGNILYLWECVSKISKKYNICQTAIYRSCRSKTISMGFYWAKISKEFYYANNYKYNQIPVCITDKRKRDLSFAFDAKKAKHDAIKKEDLIQNGIDCYHIYKNIYRATIEKYCRENKKPSYGTICNKFGSFKLYQQIILSNISL